MSKVPVAMLVGAMLAITTFYANAGKAAPSIDVGYDRALKLATDTSQKICGDVRFDGDDMRGALKAKAQAALPSLLKRWNVDLDATGSIDMSGSAYDGPSRSDLPAVIRDTQGCRSGMFRYILDLMYSARGKSPPPQQIISNPTAIAKTGDVVQQQSQNVYVNSAQMKVPSFTITQEAFSMEPTFHVVPDTPDQANSDVQPYSNGPPVNVSTTVPNVPSGETGAADIGTHSVELILGHRRRLWNGASITLIGRSLVDGHWQVALQSSELWDDQNRVELSNGLDKYHAVLVPENGEAMYVETPDGEYYLTVGDARIPQDGSPLRVTVRFNR